jgi:hypothetical protein
MTVKVSKPAINVREELADLRKPSGVAGEAMLRAETPQEQFNLIGAGRRNLVINGGFDVWQRGTSFTFSSSGGYNADRWNLYRANGSCTVTFGTDDTMRNYWSLSVTTNPTSDRVQPQQIIENGVRPNTFYTVSFLARGIGHIDDVELRQTGATSQFFYPEKGQLSELEWRKFTYTYYMPSSWDRTDSTSIVMHLSQDTDKMELAEFQFELGKVATPFEHRSFGEELALCQRFYEKSYDYGVAPAAETSNGVYWHSATSNRYGDTLGHVPFSVEKRATPSMTFYPHTGTKTANTAFVERGTTQTNPTVHVWSGTRKSVSVYSTVGATYAQAQYVFHWIADSEL